MAEAGARRWWVPVAVCGGLMAVLFARGLSWQLTVGSDPDLHLTPSTTHRLSALAIALPLIPGLGFLAVALTRRLQAKVVISLVGLLVLGLISGAALVTVLDRSSFFEELISTTRSPDGKREAYRYRASFIFSCQDQTYVGETGDAYARTSVALKRGCGGPDSTVTWLADGGVVVFAAPAR